MTPLPPALSLSALPTPLQPLPRLSAMLGLRLEVKRDDLTGSHLAGNKIRKLDYILADAIDQGATTVLTCGGLHSNHCRATALAAAPLGLRSVLLLRTANGLLSDLPTPLHGNLLLDHMAGAHIETCTPTDYREKRSAILQRLADDLRVRGETPFIVPEGGSNALGACGYVGAARELLTQTPPPDLVIVATGSGGTLAGLALGFEDANVATRAVGVAVCDDAPYFEAIVDRIAAEAQTRFGLPTLTPGRYQVLEGFQGRGYGLTTEPELDFLRETLRRDGLALDPVYTNKAFLALVRTLAQDPGKLGDPKHVVFIHTGGIFGLSSFASELSG